MRSSDDLAPSVSEPVLVSVVVIFLNAAPFIDEAIESVLAQSFESWELLLVDDGSTDGTRAVAEAWVRRYPHRMTLLEHPGRANRGMSASRNLGLRSAAGRYVAFLDADDRWTIDKLAIQVPLLEADSSLAAVFGSIRLFGGPEASVGIVRPEVPLGKPLSPHELLCATLLGRPPLLTTLGNPLIRSSALLAVGGLEDSFAGQAEDAVAWCKLVLRFPFMACGETMLEYRRHDLASGALDERGGTLLAGQTRFARWFYEYAATESPETRVWAAPIAREHLFRSALTEAWLTKPDGPFRRRVRLVTSSHALSRSYPELMTLRRRLRLGIQLVAGLRGRATRSLQERELPCR